MIMSYLDSSNIIVLEEQEYMSCGVPQEQVLGLLGLFLWKMYYDGSVEIQDA